MKVAILKDDRLDYCRSAPFHPAERYPEYPFNDLGEANAIYGKVRELFARLGMDRDHYGLASWNPLGEIISPGDQVTLKPNFVGHENPAGSLEAMITQGCIIRAVLDYVDIALKGSGSITVADAPPINADFGKIVQATGTDRIVEYYAAKAGIGVSLVDMRKECGYKKRGKLMHVELEGDPRGYTVVDLKGDSAHAHIGEDYRKFRNSGYSSHVMWEHHNRERNEYCIGNSVLGADVVLNLPKLKTHNKTGLTCALKNLIGINGYKDWLPHHLAGSREDGGDEYEKRDLRKDLSVLLRERIADTDSMFLVVPLRLASSVLYYSKVAVPFRDPFTFGCWHGNVTMPKTIADLNRIFFYADKRGQMTDAVQRKMFVLVDGIVAGEWRAPSLPPQRCAGCSWPGSTRSPWTWPAAGSWVSTMRKCPCSGTRWSRTNTRYAIPARKQWMCGRPDAMISMASTEPTAAISCRPVAGLDTSNTRESACPRFNGRYRLRCQP
jgi:hypothetical protein